jgi:hypothetical protein
VKDKIKLFLVFAPLLRGAKRFQKILLSSEREYRQIKPKVWICPSRLRGYELRDKLCRDHGLRTRQISLLEIDLKNYLGLGEDNFEWLERQWAIMWAEEAQDNQKTVVEEHV